MEEKIDYKKLIKEESILILFVLIEYISVFLVYFIEFKSINLIYLYGDIALYTFISYFLCFYVLICTYLIWKSKTEIEKRELISEFMIRIIILSIPFIIISFVTLIILIK